MSLAARAIRTQLRGPFLRSNVHGARVSGGRAASWVTRASLRSVCATRCGGPGGARATLSTSSGAPTQFNSVTDHLDDARAAAKAGDAAGASAAIERARAALQQAGRGRFAGRAVAITGGAAGIGEGCTRVFSREGGSVAIIDVDGARAHDLAEELNSASSASDNGSVALALPTDCTDLDALHSSMRAAVDAFGRMDCVVNNVGVHPPSTRIDDVTVDDLTENININLSTYLVAVKAVLAELRESRGTIVNLGSMVGALGQPDATVYAASKGAVNGLTRSLAIDLAVDGIRCNAILPSDVITPSYERWVKTLADPEAALAEGAANAALGRMARVEEMGTIALFLATDDSSFITGQCIRADGGFSLNHAQK